MRKIIYQGIIERLKTADCRVQHVSLWNESITNLMHENGYALPAVFVEFSPIKWEQCGIGAKSATATVRLHIATQILPDPSNELLYQSHSLEQFDTIDTIIDALSDLASDSFNRFQHIETIPDHNHGQVQHDIEVFVCEIKDFRAVNRKRKKR